MRRSISFILVLTIMLTFISTISVGAETFGDFQYRINNDGVSVTITSYTGQSEDLLIPSMLDGKSVTQIEAWFGAWSLNKGSKIRSLTISEGITHINEYAFNGCSSLQTINVPNSLISIGTGAFGGTPWHNNLPNGVAYLGKVVYKYIGVMAENTHITLKEGTTSIATSAFSQQSNLVGITISDSVTNIDRYAFYKCTSLTSILIPSSVKKNRRIFIC